jgi:hypothetical protein
MTTPALLSQESVRLATLRPECDFRIFASKKPKPGVKYYASSIVGNPIHDDRIVPAESAGQDEAAYHSHPLQPRTFF